MVVVQPKVSITYCRVVYSRVCFVIRHTVNDHKSFRPVLRHPLQIWQTEKRTEQHKKPTIFKLRLLGRNNEYMLLICQSWCGENTDDMDGDVTTNVLIPQIGNVKENLLY